MALLPAAIDPNRVSLNITPYDNDNTAAAGSTTLRHIDNSARLAWSTFGSVQSDPYRWGRATLPGYTPPAGRPTTYRTPNVSHPNLDGAASPQTIAQSARNGVPISGREPAPESRGLKINGGTVTGTTVNLNVTAGAAGTARLFLYDVNPIDGNKSYTRVWNTSCDPAHEPGAGLRAVRVQRRRRHDAAVGAGHDGRASRPPRRSGRGRDEHVVADRRHGGPAGERRVPARVVRERGERGAGVRRAGQGHVDRRDRRRHRAAATLALSLGRAARASAPSRRAC